MARYIKNDINFHGARNKTRVIENSSTKQDTRSKNNGSHSDGWGSIPNSSRNNNSNWEDAPNDTPGDSWGQDRLVSGKSERNRKFRTYKENNNCRVPIQSLPNWDEVEDEFPSLGSQRAPVPNVWEKRKRAFEEKAAIVPTSLSEEEMMIQQALELSKMETRQEEERRRQLEEEYKLQTKLLEANPDMFDEFRLGRDEFAATASGLASQSAKSFNDCPENFPSEEFVDCEDDWQYSTKKTTKEKEPKKEKKKTEYPIEEEGFQPKQTSGLPSFNSNTKPKINKVVEMFGGWGNTTKPFNQVAKASVETKSLSKSDKWETVDTNFASRSSKKSVIKDETCQPSTPTVLEVKLENTTNWDAIDAIDLKSASGTNEPERRNYLGMRDTVELNLKDCEPGYSLDQKEQEFAIQSKKKNSKLKIDMPTEVKINSSISKEDGNKTDPCFERERNRNLNESYDEIASGIGEHGDEWSNSEQFQCISTERNVGAKTVEKNIGAKIEERNVGAKIEVGSLEDKCSNSQKSIENDYDFLLSHVDDTYTEARFKDSNQRCPISVVEKSDILSKNSQPELFQATNQTASSFSYDYFLSELATQEGPTIPEPKAIKNETHSLSNSQLDSVNGGNKTNTNEINSLYGSEPEFHLPLQMPHSSLNAPPVPTFVGFPTNAEDHNLPVDNNNVNIERPKIPVPTPELTNPAFLSQPRPMMAPLMNPALMMGMNPMMMQQMMMLSNPFFAQQLQQMDMYYKSLGMPLTTGMPMFPQPMPMHIPTFHNPNLQVFGNPMSSGPGPSEENGTIPLIRTPGSQLPEPETGHLDKVPPKDTDSFWFEDYMSTEASSSFIPPPIPTPVDATPNPNVLPEGGAFASMSLNPQNTSHDELLNSGNASDRPSYVSSSKAEVPYANVPGWETGWGDIDGVSKSDSTSGWNDDNANGWGSDNAMTATSMRSSSRYASENKATCRQPASRPNLRRPKT